MQSNSRFQEAFRSTKVLRPPKHLLSTFGTTALNYVLVSTIDSDPEHSRLRQGRVTVERPKILTPEFWKKRFEGFGADAEQFTPFMEQLYGESLRSLEYTFKNNLDSTSVESASLLTVVERVQSVMAQEDSLRTALLQGPDSLWSLSVMRFVLDMSIRSFPANIRELDERGLFDPEQHAERKARLQVEMLFKRAKNEPTALPELGKFLRSSGLFEEYEDRFFGLVNSRQDS